jgi:hypothetical protein
MRECNHRASCRHALQCRFVHFTPESTTALAPRPLPLMPSAPPLLHAVPMIPPVWIAASPLPMPMAFQFPLRSMVRTDLVPQTHDARAAPPQANRAVTTRPTAVPALERWMPRSMTTTRERRGDGSANRFCSLCCNPPSHEERYYSCDEGHNTCPECLANYVLSNWRDNRSVSSGELRCCQPRCTSRPITTLQFVQFVTSKAALEVFITHTVQQTAAQCFAEAHAIVVKEAPEATAAADALLQKQLQKSMSAARMCPHCQFGPIDFFGCDDLAHHHGEKVDEGARINNSCQRCGYFAVDIASWLRWDGVVRNFDEPVERWVGSDDSDDGAVFLHRTRHHFAQRPLVARHVHVRNEVRNEVLVAAVDIITSIVTDAPRDAMMRLCLHVVANNNDLSDAPAIAEAAFDLFYSE